MYVDFPIGVFLAGIVMTLVTAFGAARLVSSRNLLDQLWNFVSVTQEKRDRQSIEEFVDEATDVKGRIEDFVGKYQDPTTLQSALDRVPFGTVKTYSGRLRNISTDIRLAMVDFQKALEYVIVTTGRQARFDTSFEQGAKDARQTQATTDAGFRDYGYGDFGNNATKTDRPNFTRRKLSFDTEEELVGALWDELLRYFPDEKKFAYRDKGATEADEVTGAFIKKQCRSGLFPFKDFWVMGFADESFWTK